MALVLILLAIGSAVAGYVGVPSVLGGHNPLGEWLEPSFQPPSAVASTVAGGLQAETEVAGGVRPPDQRPTPRLN